MIREMMFAGMLAWAAALTPVQAAGTTANGTITINGKADALNGPAECLHAPHGSIYETPAVMWSVMMDGRGSVTHLNATIWQPASGGAAQILFHASTTAGEVDIATVTGGRVTGSAAARVERRGAGGSLFIEGRTASGQSLTMAMHCSGFAAPEDNG
jgi:hypothetical protein